MRFRKLRIAWSVAWAICCTLLIVLWGRSYFASDGLYWKVSDQKTFAVFSCNGIAAVRLKKFQNYVVNDGTSWGYVALPTSAGAAAAENTSFLGFQARNDWARFGLQAPFWFLFAISATLAALPRIPFRFSVRSLLIATTLIAVLLGGATYLLTNQALSPRIDHVDVPEF